MQDLDDPSITSKIVEVVEGSRHVQPAAGPEGDYGQDQSCRVESAVAWVLVVDTNFILSHLNLVNSLVDAHRRWGNVVMLPWATIMELDGLKKSLSSVRPGAAGGGSGGGGGGDNVTVGMLARRANNWCFEKMARKAPGLWGQMKEEALDPTAVKGDAAILDCCRYAEPGRAGEGAGCGLKLIRHVSQVHQGVPGNQNRAPFERQEPVCPSLGLPWVTRFGGSGGANQLLQESRPSLSPARLLPLTRSCPTWKARALGSQAPRGLVWNHSKKAVPRRRRRRRVHPITTGNGRQMPPWAASMPLAMPSPPSWTGEGGRGKAEGRAGVAPRWTASSLCRRRRRPSVRRPCSRRHRPRSPAAASRCCCSGSRAIWWPTSFRCWHASGPRSRPRGPCPILARPPGSAAWRRPCGRASRPASTTCCRARATSASSCRTGACRPTGVRGATGPHARRTRPCGRQSRRRATCTTFAKRGRASGTSSCTSPTTTPGTSRRS